MGDRDSVTDQAFLDTTPTDRQREFLAPTFPVVEVFGPTIQGEGPDAGLPVYFIRFGLCDYRCSWCDSMYAVDPALMREAQVPRLDVAAILERLDGLLPGARMVVLSGGNPAVHDLGELVQALHGRRLHVAVETQGSIWRPWLAQVDRLVVSPKPPSSGMATVRHEREHTRFLESAVAAGVGSYAVAGLVLKYVIFDEDDLVWARVTSGGKPCFLSVGTDPGATNDQILERYTWLCGRVIDLQLPNVKVLPQLHVLAWGHARGV